MPPGHLESFQGLQACSALCPLSNVTHSAAVPGRAVPTRSVVSEPFSVLAEDITGRQAVSRRQNSTWAEAEGTYEIIQHLVDVDEAGGEYSEETGSMAGAATDKCLGKSVVVAGGSDLYQSRQRCEVRQAPTFTQD
ncbi:hypothetical protein DFH09DRAFT_1085640 [Mycena vulgaris]|nr:hypothetical protein DFH09DRAFT_1085640 [Mycena vulgaris]